MGIAAMPQPDFERIEQDALRMLEVPSVSAEGRALETTATLHIRVQQQRDHG
jgi:hypothetical protein